LAIKVLDIVDARCDHEVYWETNLLLPFCLSGCLLLIYSMQQQHFLLIKCLSIFFASSPYCCHW